ncbi:NUDIX hydrolase [Pseudomonas sp. No.117]
MSSSPRFCCQCGSAELIRRRPAGDNHERLQCAACHHVFYDNPRIIAGCLVEHQERYLLCRRAIEPRLGYWTLPAGFMENGESAEQAALRETWEESGVRARILAPYSIFNAAAVNQVYLIFRAELLEITAEAGPETLERRFFAPQELPWADLAYPSIRQILERRVREQALGRHGLYLGTADDGQLHALG